MVWLKMLHVSLAYLTVTGFLLRVLLLSAGSPLLQRPWLKVAPHLIDTLLLVAGISLAFLYRMAPWVHTWLGMKILVLLLYIGFGVLAMRASSPGGRLLGLLGALLAVGYIFGLAYTKQLHLGLAN